jgi:pimeloyl-ACP methyl ester carboxylesterase
VDRLSRFSAHLLATLLTMGGPLVVGPAWTAGAAPVIGDFSGLVDIGGRSIYLECRGQGGPTVILEAGANGRGDVWSRDNLRPAGERAMVQPAVAAMTRVCAYDRPGTLGEVNPELEPNGPEFYPSRSDPVPQPRTTQELTDDLHALLTAAQISGPYVLVAHSAGGLVARLFAADHPDDVVGMVLIDSTNENVWQQFKAVMTAEQWARFEASTLDNSELLAAYPEAEMLWTAPLADTPSVTQVRQARRDAPLRPMPLVVLAHGIPFADPFPGWPSEATERVMRDAQDDIAGLVPDARLMIATGSGHNIHQDQPDLVIEAVRQVVTAVRDPSTWTVR